MKTFYKNELEPLVLFLASIVVFGLLSVFGMVYNLGKSIVDGLSKKTVNELYYKWMIIIYIPFAIIGYWLSVLYQLWNVAKYFMMKIAIGIDLFGNVAGGELIEDCVTVKEHTWYGKGDYTISAATGKLESNHQLNKFGLWFTKLLSTVLGENHSVDVYNKEMKK